MMRLFRRCTRISILSLLAISVFTPVFLLSFRLKNLNTDASRDFVEDLSILKHRIDAQANSAVQQEEVEGLKGPHLVVYRDGDHDSLVSLDENDRRHKAENVNLLQSNGTTYGGQEKNQRNLSEQKVSPSREKEKSRSEGVQHSRSIHSHPRRPLDEKVKEMKDKVIRAKAYLSFAPPDSNSHFVKEIKLRIKELERAMGDVTKDSGLSRRATQKMKAMDGTLLKASRIYPDCSAMVNTLRAMTYNAEEQLRSQRDQTSFLVQLAARTTPKGLHCLSMRLTTEYFALQPEEREFPNQHKLQDPDLYHFAVFSDNVLACSVVVNTTVSTAKGSKRRLLKAGSLPLGWMTFYKHTHALDRTWHLLGLGYDSGVTRAQIEQAAVIHYDGVMKPWLDIGVQKYKSYWNKHVSYEHPYLQQCNLHE